MSGSIGTDPRIDWQVSPTGGIVVLKLKSDTDPSTWSLVRSVVSGATTVQPTTLFSGLNTQIPVYLDIGDGLKTPLDPNLEYQYAFTTASGTTTTFPIQPATSIQIEPDHLTPVIIRALTAGMRSLKIPAGFNNRPTVFYAMPMGSQPTLPMVSVNDTLLQQEQIPIGQNSGAASNVAGTVSVIGGLAMRHYTICVLTATAEERRFYRDAVLGVLHTMMGTVLNAIGENATHRFQVNSSQDTGDGRGPGFYFAEIMFELTGNFSVGVTTEYGLIEEIDGYINGSEAFIDT